MPLNTGRDEQFTSVNEVEKLLKYPTNDLRRVSHHPPLRKKVQGRAAVRQPLRAVCTASAKINIIRLFHGGPPASSGPPYTACPEVRFENFMTPKGPGDPCPKRGRESGLFHVYFHAPRTASANRMERQLTYFVGLVSGSFTTSVPKTCSNGTLP